MCGIVGIAGARICVQSEQLARMSETLRHRGPDQAGLWCSADKTAGLAHRRLSILDLSDAAKQPMASIDGTQRIIFNGEIYNYRGLRDELAKRGYVFRTSSDTEVLLAAFAEWG